MNNKPIFDHIGQVSIIVDDIFTWIKRYNDEYGIGPWIVMHFTPENTKNMVVRGNNEPFEMYLALCESLNIQLELIQPVSENTTYAEFLRTHGPGLHHLCMGSKDGYSDIMSKLKDQGYEEKLLAGVDSGGMEFCYIDLTDDLGFIAEFMNPPADVTNPTPVYVYPEPQKK